ncbi:hypothetical protein [Butyrivibrio sp. NC2002]|uniref:hypothetical protein n=1 Tax=Butyrivibrio sp. NC2002 TaxID=1410610 RepID=UPI00056CE4AA|nr:hypothetical protein [Butyrivibrio sp. NC2002]
MMKNNITNIKTCKHRDNIPTTYAIWSAYNTLPDNVHFTLELYSDDDRVTPAFSLGFMKNEDSEETEQGIEEMKYALRQYRDKPFSEITTKWKFGFGSSYILRAYAAF